MVRVHLTLDAGGQLHRNGPCQSAQTVVQIALLVRMSQLVLPSLYHLPQHADSVPKGINAFVIFLLLRLQIKCRSLRGFTWLCMRLSPCSLIKDGPALC